jgi:hypothetical protein
MSEHNTEVWADMERISRRVVLVEQMLLRRILALEAEVKALKGQTQGQAERTIYQDAHEIDWCAPLAAESAIARIMQKE